MANIKSEKRKAINSNTPPSKKMKTVVKDSPEQPHSNNKGTVKESPDDSTLVQDSGEEQADAQHQQAEQEIEKQLLLDEQLARILTEEMEQEDSEYEIEEIVNHSIFKGKVVRYEIKWKGYAESENTLETASEIHNDVPDLCEKYWDSLSIKRPVNAPGYDKVENKKTSRPSKAKPVKTKQMPTEVDEEKVSMLDVPRFMAQKGFIFPISHLNDTQWTSDLKRIVTVQLSPIDKAVVLVYVEWHNGEKTIHTLKEIHEKCPGRLIDYYETRLKFI